MERENKNNQGRTVIIKDEALKRFQGGFTSIPNVVLRNSKLSIGARITYAMLLKYAWQDDFCWPAQAKIADDLGLKARMVRYHLDELKKHKLIDWKRQGLNRPNIYYILRLPEPEPVSPDRQYIATPEWQHTAEQERQQIAAYVDTENNTKYVNVSNDTSKTGEWSPPAVPALAPLTSNGNEGGQNGKPAIAHLVDINYGLEEILTVFPSERAKKISVNFFRKALTKMLVEDVLRMLNVTKYDTLIDPSSKGTARNPAAIFTKRLKELAVSQGIQL